MKKSSFSIIIGLFVLLSACSSIKTPPAGVDFESKEFHTEIAEFNYDLSYLTKDGDVAYDTNIFKNI